MADGYVKEQVIKNGVTIAPSSTTQDFLDTENLKYLTNL